MAVAAVQTNRPLSISTPLGKDVLKAVSLQGTESISQIYRFHCEVITEVANTVNFDSLLGEPVSVRLEVPFAKSARFFSGIVSRLVQGESDNEWTSYSLEIVPSFWLLSKVSQSRIFQHESIPDILKKVLVGFDVSFELVGTFHPRDYVVQYRETDFNFACRLMEEEGMYFFFKHTEGGHKMIVANSPQSHTDIPCGSTIEYRHHNHSDAHVDDVIYDWNKSQEVTTGKFTLWDHCFEQPPERYPSEKPLTPTAQMGQVSHKLKLKANANLEQYDYPGIFAQRFDGINKSGGEQPAELGKISPDGARVVDLKMQAAAAASITATGASTARNLVAGHKFTLKTLPTDKVAKAAKADGVWMLTSVTHSCRLGSSFRSGDSGEFTYDNKFQVIPHSLPYKPLRTSPRPTVLGAQTATVVGPPGEEIFTDKYGRVKVQFHWDRQGKKNAESSCWIRVGLVSAGKGWGMVSIPRIGQEVIVDFLEGDMDQPIIVGCVHNAQQMPAYKLPDNKTRSWIKTNSSPGGNGYNEIRFEDKAGKEQIFIHGQKDLDMRIKYDRKEYVGHDFHLHVVNTSTTKIDSATDVTIGGPLTMLVKKDVQVKEDENHDYDLGKNLTEHVGENYDLKVDKDQAVETGQSWHLTVGKDMQTKVAGKTALDSGAEIHFKSKTIVIEAGMDITIKGAGGFIKIDPSGITIVGTMVKVNSGGSPGTGSGASPKKPAVAKKANPKTPAAADNSVTGQKSCD